jgi:hypothetical protein
MGADIHVVCEVMKEPGRWQLHLRSPLSDHRDYNSFGALAGVRADAVHDDLSYPRGLPKDMGSDIDWLGDHSHHWLTLKELKKIKKKCDKMKDEYGYGLIDNLIEELVEIARWTGVVKEDRIRIIMGFDS